MDSSDNESQVKRSFSESEDSYDASVKRAKGSRGAPIPLPASSAGSSCHQCKSRRKVSDLIYCTNIVDKKSKSCRKKYCEHCLRKFYKEEPLDIPDRKNWSCPSCRKLCCCAACRRREQKEKFGISSGFSSQMTYTFPDQSSSEEPNSKSSFALLYAVAQMPSVQKLISEILKRDDITDSEKVESIATLLRGAVTGGDDS